jgi:hypothetical protein
VWHAHHLWRAHKRLAPQGENLHPASKTVTPSESGSLVNFEVRQQSWSTARLRHPGSDGSSRRAGTLSIEDLTVWRSELPNVKFAVLPPENGRPNPPAADHKLLASVFSSGTVCASQPDSVMPNENQASHAATHPPTYGS